MTILFVESFDHYDDGDILKKWDEESATPTIGSGDGRQGSDACSFSGGDRITKFLQDDLDDEIIVGFAFNSATVQATTLLQIINLGITINVQLNSDGSFDFGTFTSDPTLYGASEWNYLEAYVISNNDPEVGYLELRLNGETVISGYEDTGGTNSNAIREISFVNGTASIVKIDDIYVLDPTRGDSTNFLGDVHIALATPDATVTGDFNIENAASNHAAVNGNPIDETSWVFSATSADQDLYDYTTPALPGSPILGVQVNTYARKNAGGLRQFRHLYGNGVSTTTGEINYVNDNFKFYTEIQEREPVSNNLWTEQSIEDAEFGIEIV